MSKGHIIVLGATVYCTQSMSCNSPMTAVPLNITSQNLVVANGGKFVATNKDNTVINMNFGICNDPKYPTVKPPCIAQVQWSNYYEPIDVDKQGLKLLTEESVGICNMCSIPGRIKIAHHGQVATVAQNNIRETDSQILSVINPLVATIINKRISDIIIITE